MTKSITLSLLIISHLAVGQSVINLYPGTAPGSETWTWTEKTINNPMWGGEITYNVVNPTLTAYLPPKETANGTAVIIAPGGAFHTLSTASEGSDVAKWLNSKGVAAFVLKYRVVHSITDDPVSELMAKMSDFKKLDEINAPVVSLALSDGLTAVKHLRENAAMYNIKTDQIGFMGFSAGATLTMSVVYNASEADRPNFVAPIYVYKNGILGSEIPKAKTPIFVAVAADDQLGLMPNSIDIFNEWFKAKQPAELHVYETGGHGFGMRKQKMPVDDWHERFGDWLGQHGYMTNRLTDGLTLYLNRETEKMKVDFGNLARYKTANNTAKNKRAVLIGDSITDSWPNVDSSFFKTNAYVGRGISGQTSPQLLLRFKQDVLDLKPKAVVINVGTNDVAENTGPYSQDFTLGNIRAMAELAKANGIKPILTSVLPASEFRWRPILGDRSKMIVELNTAIKALALTLKIPYLDYHTLLKNDKNGMDPELAKDGVHPTPKAYKIMSAEADKTIKKALNIPAKPI